MACSRRLPLTNGTTPIHVPAPEDMDNGQVTFMIMEAALLSLNGGGHDSCQRPLLKHRAALPKQKIVALGHSSNMACSLDHDDQFSPFLLNRASVVRHVQDPGP